MRGTVVHRVYKHGLGRITFLSAMHLKSRAIFECLLPFLWWIFRRFATKKWVCRYSTGNHSSFNFLLEPSALLMSTTPNLQFGPMLWEKEVKFKRMQIYLLIRDDRSSLNNAPPYTTRKIMGPSMLFSICWRKKAVLWQADLQVPFHFHQELAFMLMRRHFEGNTHCRRREKQTRYHGMQLDLDFVLNGENILLVDHNWSFPVTKMELQMRQIRRK